MRHDEHQIHRVVRRDEAAVSGVPTDRPGTAGRRLGRQLRDAREVKGIDLFRVERDTKIRSKYLSALEEGDYADLPGDVYTRGFLRNYSAYLGLDADEIEEEWRSESGSPDPAKPAIVGPQPMTIRRGIVFQRSHAVIAVVLVIVLVVATYFGLQLTRYLSYPVVALDSNVSTPVTVPIGSTSYVSEGHGHGGDDRAASPGTGRTPSSSSPTTRVTGPTRPSSRRAATSSTSRPRTWTPATPARREGDHSRSGRHADAPRAGAVLLDARGTARPSPTARSSLPASARGDHGQAHAHLRGPATCTRDHAPPPTPSTPSPASPS